MSTVSQISEAMQHLLSQEARRVGTPDWLCAAQHGAAGWTDVCANAGFRLALQPGRQL